MHYYVIVGEVKIIELTKISWHRY